MTKLTFYYSLISQPSRAVYLFLKIAGIPFEGKALDLIKDQFSEAFKGLSPLKRLPIIDHDGIILTGSTTILNYLCQAFNVADHWSPEDIEKEERVDNFLDWQYSNIEAYCTLYVLHKVYLPMINGEPVNVIRVAQIETNMSQALDEIEHFWLKNKQFISGDEISIADIIGICQIDQLSIAGYDAFTRRPNLFMWKTRIVSILSPYYEESNAVINSHAARFNRKYGVLKPRI